MKIGDYVVCEGKEGKIIRFQPKTRDLIVKDSNGEIHTFSQFTTELKNAAG
jgi:hypothetical protein